jgi:hypothetical protein
VAIDLIVRCFDPRLPVKGSEQVLLMRLCEIARANGDRVVMGLEKLASHCHITDRQARDYLRRLEAKRLIRSRLRTGPNHANEYWVTLPDLGGVVSAPPEPPALPDLPAMPTFHVEPTPEVSGSEVDEPLRRETSGVEGGDDDGKLPVTPEESGTHSGRNQSPLRRETSAIPVSVSHPPPRADAGPEHRALLIAAWVRGGGWTTFRGDDLSEAILAAVGRHDPEQVVANLERWRRGNGDPIHLPPDYQRAREQQEKRAAQRVLPPPPPAPVVDQVAVALAAAHRDAAKRQSQSERAAALAELGALWLRVRDGAALDEAQRRLWVDSPKVWPRRLEGARLVLVSPTALFADTLRKRFVAPLAVALAAELGVPEAEVAVELANESTMAGSAA